MKIFNIPSNELFDMFIIKVDFNKTYVKSQTSKNLKCTLWNQDDYIDRYHEGFPSK